MPATAASATAESMRTALMMEMKNLFELGALSKDDLKLVDTIVPDPGAWRQDRAMAQMDQLNRMIQTKMNAQYSRLGQNPGRVDAKFQTVGK